MEEWKEYTLSDLGTIVGGATPSTKDSSNYENGSIAWITPKDLSTHTERFISHGERNITEKGLKSCSAQLMPPNSILFTSRAPIGYIAIAKNEVCTNQGFKSIVPNKDTDFMFLYYLLKYNKDNIENLGSGTTFKEVSGSTMRNVPVKVPPLPTQQKIAAILSSLDDKIELNNKINDNLEQQAQALFKNWFVDFEPFGGKMPEGWKVGKLSEIGTIVGGSTPSKAKKEYYTNKGIAWITPKDLSNDKSKFISHGEIDITELGFKNSSAIKMPKGTVLYSSRAPIGYIAISKNEVTTNQGFKSVIPNPNVGNAYIYYFLRSNFELIDNMASGSTFKEISGTAMKNVPVLIPDDKTLFNFQTMCETLFLQQELLENENVTLSTIRDTLLSKLMNGEIEVGIK